MIFKAEINLDWIDDDRSFDEIVKDEITGQVIKKVSDMFINQMESDNLKRITEKLDKASQHFEEKIDDTIREKFTEYTDKRITITDSWGKVVHEDITVEELIKKRIDDYLSRNVDRNGYVVDSRAYRSSTDMKYIEWLLAEKVEKACKVMTENITKQVEISIKDKLNEELKNRVSSKLMSKIDIDSAVAKVFGLEG